MHSRPYMRGARNGRSLLAVAVATLAVIATTGTFARAAEPTIQSDEDGAPPFPPPPQRPPPPPRHHPSSGIMLGAALRYVAPVVLLAPDPAPGPGVAVSVGYRWRYLYVGAAYEHASFGAGSWGEKTVIETILSAKSDYGGIEVSALTHPEAPVAFFGGVGAGFRTVTSITTWTNTSTISSVGTPVTKAGLDVTFPRVGVEIHPCTWLRIVPEGSLSFGLAGVYAAIGVRMVFDLVTEGHQ